MNSGLPSSYSVHNVSPLGQPPYFDFMSIRKRTNTFNKEFLTQKSQYKYQLKRDFTPLDIGYSEKYNSLFVNGSLPWFTNGHNLSFSQEELESTINYLSMTLDIDMTSAIVRCFELSKMMFVNYPVAEYQNNHYDLKGFERVNHQNTLYYNRYTRRGRKELTLKLYDATANAIQKKMSIKPWGSLLKYEMKLDKPEKYFRHLLTVSDLIEDKSIINKTYSEMKHHYENITKGVVVNLSDNPSTEDFLLAGLIKSNPNPMPMLEQLINSSGLDAQARWRRRNNVKEKLSKITIEESKYKLDL
jgi:hypothetical protein